MYRVLCLPVDVLVQHAMNVHKRQTMCNVLKPIVNRYCTICKCNETYAHFFVHVNREFYTYILLYKLNIYKIQQLPKISYKKSVNYFVNSLFFK